MKTRKTTALGRLTRAGLLAIALATVTGTTLVAPAFADEWRHGGDARDWRAHEWRHDDHDVRWYAPGFGFNYGYVAPGYNYGYVAPGYAPAPVYSYPVPFVNFGFSFR